MTNEQGFAMLDAVPTGRENAVPVQSLADMLGIDRRQLRRLVEAYRESGRTICCASDGTGYFHSNDPHELRQFSRRMTSHARSMMRSARSADLLAERLEREMRSDQERDDQQRDVGCV